MFCVAVDRLHPRENIIIGAPLAVLLEFLTVPFDGPLSAVVLAPPARTLLQARELARLTLAPRARRCRERRARGTLGAGAAAAWGGTVPELPAAVHEHGAPVDAGRRVF